MYSKKCLQECKQLLKNNDIEYSFVKTNKYYIGYALPNFNKVYINLNKINNNRLLVSVVCHELAHVLCYRNNKYKKFHTVNLIKKLPLNSLKAVLYTALKAERYVDRLGKIICNYNFNKYNYLSSYTNNKTSRKFLKLLYLDNVSQEIKRRNRGKIQNVR